MTHIAILAGTGVAKLNGFTYLAEINTSTPYGNPLAPLVHGELCGVPIVFLARHGNDHTIPPHKINYRANIWALHNAGIKEIIAIAAVGSIDDSLYPSRLVFPDQIIDYTYAREHTFFNGGEEGVDHIDFTHPYCKTLRELLVNKARELALNPAVNGVYAATQGPRLETAAEIDRLERDGCAIVGMTGMPEAALARELGLCYAACAVVANRAAGRGQDNIVISEIYAAVAKGIKDVEILLQGVLPVLAKAH